MNKSILPKPILYAVCIELHDQDGVITETFTHKEGAEVWKETYEESFLSPEDNATVSVQKYLSVSRLESALEEHTRRLDALAKSAREQGDEKQAIRIEGQKEGLQIIETFLARVSNVLQGYQTSLQALTLQALTTINLNLITRTMKHWKEVPHLFANGKFKATPSLGTKFYISGIHNNYLLTPDKDSYFNIGDCTLIARPISDMSDKELQVTHRQYSIPYNRSEIIEFLTGSKLSADDMLYLLSIGVYPFDQENPKDVIWRYETEDKKIIPDD